jgi:hypothetical protein
MRFQNLSTVEHCTYLGLEQRSSVCRYAVSLGLVVYYPYGQTGTEPYLPSPEALSTDDIPIPTPGWMAPVEQAYHTPTKDAHIMAREWAESTLMTDHLVCLASRWMMSFHAAFLDKTVTTLALEMRQTEVLFLTYWTHITHKPRFARRNQVRYGAAFSSAAQALRYAATETDVRYIYILPVSQCQIIDQTAPHLAIPGTLAHAVDIGAVLVDIASIPTDHSLAHVPPLPVSDMRPLALGTDDPLQVNVWLNDAQFSIHTICDTMEWMGQTTQVHHTQGRRSLHVICDASLQKQVHPHMLGMYLSQPELSANDSLPHVRWPDKRDSIRTDRHACTQLVSSLVWVFLYQPLSNLRKDEAYHRRWVLALMTRTPNRQEWIGTYQSTSPNAAHITMFRPNMADRPLPALTPMADQRYSFRYTSPLAAVWFRATQPSSGLCCSPPYMDPVSYIIETMRRAKEARLCVPPRLWKDLLGYHKIGEGMMNPVTGSSLDVIDTFSRFDSASFPCEKKTIWCMEDLVACSQC